VKLVPRVKEFPEQKKLNFIVSKNMFDLLDQRAKEEGRTPSEVVREAIRDYLIK
jgi:predicted DNA-binding protein